MFQLESWCLWLWRFYKLGFANDDGSGVAASAFAISVIVATVAAASATDDDEDNGCC